MKSIFKRRLQKISKVCPRKTPVRRRTIWVWYTETMTLSQEHSTKVLTQTKCMPKRVAKTIIKSKGNKAKTRRSNKVSLKKRRLRLRPQLKMKPRLRR
jgi:hypothetical protein